MIEQRIVAQIKHLCRKNGKPLREVEEACGVSPGYFSRCKSGRAALRVSTLVAAAEVFGVDWRELSEYTGGWRKRDMNKPKSIVYICPECEAECYCAGGECFYKYCPNCGMEIKSAERP